MRSVSRFESNLLRILQCFLGHGSVEQVQPLILQPISRPTCLSRDAIDLVQQFLARGTVMLLARDGAWTQQRHLRNDQISEGSLWQRTKPEDLGLEFSAASLDFLIWFTAADVGKESTVWVPDFSGSSKAGNESLTVGDHFLLHLAVRKLRNALISHWFENQWCRTSPLIALTMPERFAERNVVPDVDFSDWTRGIGSCVLEAMQDDLARAWIRIERNKAKVSDTELMIRIGRVQASVLESFFDAVERDGRRDLCRFVLTAADELLDGRTRHQQWTGSLNTNGLRLAERTEAYESASAFLRAAARLRTWHGRSLSVGYFDEGYAESQLYKSMWESAHTEDALQHADRILQELSF